MRTPTSFALVFERHFASIHRYVYRRLGPDLAADVTAETFFVAFDRRAGYKPVHSDARPWLFGIASNLVRRHWRDELRWGKACERMARETAHGETDGDRPLVPTDLDEEVRNSLRALSKRDRETLLLLAWAELSYEEISLALGVPIGTVRSRISRARRQIRKRLSLDATFIPKQREDYSERA